MLALGAYESGVCDCGVHESLTEDKSNVFTFEDRHCPVCRGVARYQRVQTDMDEKATKALGENPPPHSPRPSDGRRTFVRQMSPTEVEARRARRSSASG